LLAYTIQLRGSPLRGQKCAPTGVIGQGAAEYANIVSSIEAHVVVEPFPETIVRLKRNNLPMLPEGERSKYGVQSQFRSDVVERIAPSQEADQDGE
jgi:hypothetical protein